MTRILSIAGLVALTIALAAISYTRPEWLADGNSFLRDFVNHELLAVLGVIVTITLASAANLHLALNRLEDATEEGFAEARAATKAYAYLLIALFALAVALVILKPIFAGDAGPMERRYWEAAFNSGAIWIIALNILALMDLTAAVFAIPADRSLKK